MEVHKSGSFSMKDRRFGRFSLSLDFLDQRPDLARLVLKDVIVLEAKSYPLDNIEYTGIHPDWEFVPVGSDIPIYEAIVVGGTSPKVKWFPDPSWKPPPPPPPEAEVDFPYDNPKATPPAEQEVLRHEGKRSPLVHIVQRQRKRQGEDPGW
jgi:hypothetical protein